ncbi:MAG: hypothetical protein ACE147_20560 [Candidatus Methylomirabilales bacterium]
MLYTTWSLFRLILGTALMLIGVLGTLLPVIPGLPVFLAGVAVAGSSHPVTRFVRERWKMWRAWSRPPRPPGDEGRFFRRLLRRRPRRRPKSPAAREPGRG